MFVKYLIKFSLCISYIQHAVCYGSPTLRDIWCAGAVPSSVEIRDDIWKRDLPVDLPKEDDLDRYMVQRTGCSYRAIEYAHGFYPIEESEEHIRKYGEFDRRSKTFFNGSLFEWRGAIRAPAETAIQISWGNETGYVTYNFYIGYDNNTITKMYLYGTEHEWTLSTPGIHTIERYVPFYVRIESGVMTFGKDCEEPMFTHNVTVGQGEWIQMYGFTWSFIGAKYLFDCPDSLPGRAGSSNQHQKASYLVLLSFLLSLSIKL